MIASISGIVRDIDHETLVVENQGIGYIVYVPKPTTNRVKIGEQVFLFTQLLVREDSLTLVGFETVEARKLFNLLLSVSGVGYKLALSILSALSGEVLRGAIVQNNVELLTQVPGLGKKTAQKIIFSLQDKLKEEGSLENLATFSEVDGDVLAALTALGYSVIEAQAAIQSIPRDVSQDIETRLRYALNYFNR
ncbi:MAG: Holliday junction branch migration protein RuvA [Anaerolineales bacterium]